MYTVLFECHHLYYLPNFIPVIQEMKKREKYNLSISIPFNSNNREKNIFIDTVKSLGIKLIEAESEKQRLIKIKKKNFDIIIVGNVGQLNKITNKDTIAVMVYHGIGLKQSYYIDTDSRIDIRAVESLPRLDELKKNRHDNLVLTGFTKCDPLKNKRSPIDLEKLKFSRKKKTMLYAPSFYPSSIEKILPYLPELAKDINIIIKLHDFSWHKKRYSHQSEEMLKIEREYPNIFLVPAEDYNIIPFYRLADILLSDISSTIFEFLYLNKPIIIADFYTLRLKHRFFKKIFFKKIDMKRMKGIDFADRVKDPENLQKILSETIHDPSKYKQQRKKAQKEYLYKTDGKASWRLVNNIELNLS